jgi:hypothetical protein
VTSAASYPGAAWRHGRAIDAVANPTARSITLIKASAAQG